MSNLTIHNLLEWIKNAWHKLTLKNVVNETIHENYVPIPREPFQSVHTPEPKVSKAKRKKSKIPETLAELLDDIEVTFGALKLPDANLEWVDKKDRKGLRKLGVHIPSPWLFHWNDGPIMIDRSKSMPSMMCVSFPVKDEEKDFVYPKLAFAVRIPKLPAVVTQHRGIPYMFGYAVTSPADDLKDSLMWGHCLIAIDSQGTIRICDEFHVKTIQIPVENPVERKRFGRMRTICTKGWNHPLLLRDRVNLDTGRYKTWDETRTFEKNVIWNVFEYWRKRSERWQVAVTHGEDRITFGIDFANTKHYFADRDKTIKAADGKAKRIIHHVSEHKRVYPSGKVATVKEHVRGIAEFDWKGYHCAVTAPQLNGMIVSSVFDAEPEFEDETNKHLKFVQLDEVGDQLFNHDLPEKRIH